ncbi:hypothetical protein DMN91_012680 [Ooceraea biroi]|uniref:FAM194 C-terminal domain-containing protein n=2 Tax=Ooceraea biroi TaxID=2015173 RepID=A0A3L8D462_OOCBI|nr:hypothetical protein DMN91_012680 [Ooceraea biroi]
MHCLLRKRKLGLFEETEAVLRAIGRDERKTHGEIPFNPEERWRVRISEVRCGPEILWKLRSEEKEMRSCYGDSQIERIKSPLSVAVKRKTQIETGDSSICETINPSKYKTNHSSKNTLQKKEFKKIHNTDNAELLFSGKDNTSTLEDDSKNHDGFHNAQMKTIPRIVIEMRNKQQHNTSDSPRKIGRPVEAGVATDHHDGIASGDLSEANGNRSLDRGKTVTSASEARSGGGARNTGIVAERIRGEERDNNPYHRERGEVEDKDRQDRHRSARRDVEEEANRSWIAAGKRGRGEDAEDAMAEENAGERGNPGRGPYQYPCGTRSLDNSARIGRGADRDEKSSPIELSGKPAKRPEMERDGNGQRDRHKNEEQPVTCRDSGRAEEDENEGKGTTSLSENKQTRAGNKRTMNSLDDAEKSRFVANEEEKLPANDEKRRAASNDGRYNSEEERWRVSNNPSNLIEYRLSDEHFVKPNWTLLPVTRTMRKIVQYEARPAKPNLDWFKRHRHRGTEYYNDGLMPFLKFYPDGSGEVFYPNGVLAIRVYRPENRKYDMYTVFTPGGKDAVGIEREPQILAIFDTMGNGVVFDEDGAARLVPRKRIYKRMFNYTVEGALVRQFQDSNYFCRLSYNQIGGIFTDNPTGRPLVWTWNANPQESILETVYTEKSTDRLQMKFFPSTFKLMNSSGNVKTPISPSSSRNKEKKVVEVQKPVVEERQEEVGSKIELGTIVNFNKEVAAHMIEATDWKSDMLRCKFQEQLPEKLDADNSLYDLAKEYRKVKRFAKERRALIAKYKPFSELKNPKSVRKDM